MKPTQDPSLNPGAGPPPIITVSLVEDERGTRDNFVALINRTPGLQCLEAYQSAEQALEGLPAATPDVLLMDLHLPGLSGVECVRRLRTVLPDLKIVILTKFVDADHLFQALKAGANGYLSKQIPPEELLQSLRNAQAGGAPLCAEIALRMVQYFHQQAARENPREKLAPREREVLELLTRGHSYKEIAARLALTYDTVNGYVKTLYAKLHVHSRAEAVAKLRGESGKSS